MKILKVVSVIGLLFLSACNSTQKSNITNYQTAGNLSANNEIGCINVNQLSNQQNPVDIFKAVHICLEKDDYKNGSELYLAGLIFGHFDTQRVEDRTAHQAVLVIQRNLRASLPQSSLKKIQTAMLALRKDNSTVCNALKKLNPPSYHPTYMIQHGMGAFTRKEGSSGLVTDFNAQSAWQKSLSDYGKCQ